MQSLSIQGKEGWSETGFQKRNKWEHFRHHTHMHMYTHSMQQPPQANTTTQPWHKAHVDATKCSEELQYQHESWWSNTTLTKKKNQNQTTNKQTNKNLNKTKNKTTKKKSKKNKNKNQKNHWEIAGRGRGGKGNISFQAQSPHFRPSWMHMDLWMCEIPGMLWWPACPTLVLFLMPHHQSVKIRLLPPRARKLEAYSQFKCLANHWTPVQQTAIQRLIVVLWLVKCARTCTQFWVWFSFFFFFLNVCFREQACI